MAAFDNGLALGADGLELDVHLSRDGVVVVHHDRRSSARPPAARTAVARSTAPTSLPRARRADACATCSPRYRDARVIVELKVNTAELARACRGRRPPGRRGRPRLPRLVRPCACLRAARAIEPAIATSAAREEVRWALYRSWVGWPVARVAVRRLSGAGMGGHDARRVAPLRRAWRTAPASACRSGRSTPKTTRGGCSAGASTRSSPTGRTSWFEWSRRSNVPEVP